MVTRPLLRPAAGAAAAVAAVCGLLCCGLLACELFSPGAHVFVQMPGPPPHWQQAFPGPCFTVEYTDAQGRIRQAATDGWGAAVELVCSKAQNSPILAWPCTDRDQPPAPGSMLPPAGGFYPLSLGTGSVGVLSLSWEDGCAALVISRVRELGRDMRLFNVARLAAQMRTVEDPWTWDAAALAERIAAGDFSCLDMKRLACRDVTIAPGPGEWFLESPFSAPRSPGTDGSLLLPSVPLGPHTLFSTRGTRRRIFVGGRETVVGPEEQ